jgi:hypothetical protein
MDDPVTRFDYLPNIRKREFRVYLVDSIGSLPDDLQITLDCSLGLPITYKEHKLPDIAVKLAIDFINRSEHVIQVDLKLKLHTIIASLKISPALNRDCVSLSPL